jgi:hypothetical protein
MLRQPGEAEHQGRWPAGGDPQRRDPLDGHATLGGGFDDGGFVVAGGSSTYSWIPAGTPWTTAPGSHRASAPARASRRAR